MDRDPAPCPSAYRTTPMPRTLYGLEADNRNVASRVSVSGILRSVLRGWCARCSVFRLKRVSTGTHLRKDDILLDACENQCYERSKNLPSFEVTMYHDVSRYKQ
jgi:hypothetical protein